MGRSNMGIRHDFETKKVGAAEIDMATSIFSVNGHSMRVTKGEANIIAVFMFFGERNERFSAKTFNELIGSTSTESLGTRLSELRKKLKVLEIANGIYADSLFLSDRLAGKSEGGEKLPYHFNTDLANTLKVYGWQMTPRQPNLRLNPHKIIGKLLNPKDFASATTPPNP